MYEKESTTLTAGTHYTFADVDGIVPGDKKGGFNLTIPNAGESSDKYTITYTTHYDIKDASDPSTPEYINKAQVKWNTSGTDYNSPEVSSTVEINTQQTKNGYKEGNYNYEQKKFNWEVGINYNFDTITTPKLIDTLPISQIIDRDSIKVYNLNLSGGGNGVISGAALIEGTDYTLTPAPITNTFELIFNNEINSPYRVVYTSTTKHDYYAPQTNTYKIKNIADFYNGLDKRSSWNKEVEVKHSNKLITKTPTQDGGSSGSGSALVRWTLNLNWSQSTLKNPVITDTVGKDAQGDLLQKIYKDSFKITEMNFSGTNSTPTRGTEHSPGGALFDIAFNEGNEDPTFTITFKQDINKAYIIEYDSYFLGSNGTNIENSATLSYKHNLDDVSGETGNSSQEAYTASFSYFGGAFANKGQIEITKVDENNPTKTLSGAVFQLWNKAVDGVMIEEVSTDTNGVYLFKTKLGYATYYLVETKAPDFYDLGSSAYKTRKPITIGNALQDITITNQKFKQAVELTKLAAHDNTLALQGVKYDLKKKDAGGIYNLLQNLVTDVNGKINIDELLPGDYQLIETETLPLYQLDSTPLSFTIVAGQTATIEKNVKNTKLGNLTILKKDKADNIPLSGAVFTLTDVNDNTHKYVSNTTLADGIANFANVKYGEYKLTETTAPTGYVGGSELTITLDDSNNILISGNEAKIIEIENEKIYQAVKLSKKDKDDSSKNLADAVFALYKSNDDSVVLTNATGEAIGNSEGHIKTDVNGLISINNLPEGNYYFKEITAPKYYLLPELESDRKYNFEIALNQTSFTEVNATNAIGKGSIKIKKVDASDRSILLSGVVFDLFNKDGFVVTGTTDANGEIIFTDLSYDLYKIKEKVADPDYVLNSSEIEIDLDGLGVNGFNIEKEITNIKKDHSVKLTKYNQNSTLRLKGAVFELYKYSDGVYTKVIDVTTNDSGEIYLADLTPAKYKFVEITPPAGYLLDTNPIEFDILDNQIDTLLLEMTNRLRPSGGGGGGNPPPTTPPTTPPTVPPTTPPTTPTTPPVTPPTPPVTPPKVTTPEDVPVQGEVDVPDNEVPRVGVPPENGTVTVDEDGKWIYTPDPDFVGEDSFTIIVGDEEIVIDIDVEEVPLGTVTPPQEDLGDDTPTGVPSLPKTGGMSSLYLYIAGSIFVLIGLLSKKKNML